MCNEISEGEYQAELGRLESLSREMAAEENWRRLIQNDAEELWVTRGGKKIDYSRLSDTHLYNVHAMMKRRGYLDSMPRLRRAFRLRNAP